MLNPMDNMFDVTFDLLNCLELTRNEEKRLIFIFCGHDSLRTSIYIKKGCLWYEFIHTNMETDSCIENRIYWSYFTIINYIHTTKMSKVKGKP